MTEETTQQQMEQLLRSNLEIVKKATYGKLESMMNIHFGQCSLEDKSLTLLFPVEQWELNPLGIMHGGIITAAFDTTFGTLTHYFGGNQKITTVTISTTFLKPIQLGDEIAVTVKATSLGRTLVSFMGEAYSRATGKLSATATATFMILKDPINDKELLLNTK